MGKFFNNQEYWELLLAITSQLKRKYNSMNELLNLTKEMVESLDRNDRVSAQMQLAMRHDEIQKVNQCERNIGILLDSISEEKRNRIKNFMQVGPHLAIEPLKEESQIHELYMKNRRALQKIIEIDKHISKKIAGDDSYYSEAK